MESQRIDQRAGLTLAIIGCGAMGSAILSGILTSAAKASSLEPALISNFIACVASQASVEKLEATFTAHKDYLTILQNANVEAIRKADIVLLACKPYMAQTVLSQQSISTALKGKLLISVLAGTTTDQLNTYIQRTSQYQKEQTYCIIRAMPNMAAQISESITVITEPTPPSAPFAAIAAWIFSQVGSISYVPDNLFQAASVLAGATPAFFTVAFDGILDGAVAKGFKRDLAKEVLAQSLLGAAKLLQNGEHPAVLREKISSPKGTTIQGLLTLEREATRADFANAFMASTEHGEKMG